MRTPARGRPVAAERRDTFECFGGRCTVVVSDALRPGDAEASLSMAKSRLLEWHRRFSRFEPDSELSRMNADPSSTVHVSSLLRRVVEASLRAAEATGGLVDPTLVTEIERAGYVSHLEGNGVPPRVALSRAPPRAPGGPNHKASWRAIGVDRRAGTVSRPPGVQLDIGGIAKGAFADELGALLRHHDAFVVDCAGDLLIGGTAGLAREVHVASPFADAILHTLAIERGGVATSGIGKRSWIGPDGDFAHHLLDPRSGRPAFTGVVQATALAPTAIEAESLTKAAILSGPREARGWLPQGGVLVFDDGSYQVVDRG